MVDWSKVPVDWPKYRWGIDAFSVHWGRIGLGIEIDASLPVIGVRFLWWFIAIGRIIDTRGLAAATFKGDL